MQKDISRRGFLLSSAVAGIGTIASRAATLKLVSESGDGGLAEPGGAITLTDGGGRSLLAIPPSDPRFEEMVNEHFPALLPDQTFEALKGVCVVLHNEQGRGSMHISYGGPSHSPPARSPRNYRAFGDHVQPRLAQHFFTRVLLTGQC